MYILFFLISFAYAEVDRVRSMIETTYTRDNTYCKLGRDRTQIQIRSKASKTEPHDKKYGEHVFYYPDDNPKFLPLNDENLSNYRFFEGESSLCSKSHGYRIDKNLVAILFLKENGPHRDLLTIQLFNTKSFLPEKVIDTEYPTEDAAPFKDGFIFNNFIERIGIEMGKIHFSDTDFTYQDRDFPLWMNYDKQGFAINPSVTYAKFHWKNYFKEQKEFQDAAGWDEKEKKFKNTVLYVAVNHIKKKECILLAPNKLRVTGAESGWHCN